LGRIRNIDKVEPTSAHVVDLWTGAENHQCTCASSHDELHRVS
jgi:hypothetical protein